MPPLPNKARLTLAIGAVAVVLALTVVLRPRGEEPAPTPPAPPGSAPVAGAVAAPGEGGEVTAGDVASAPRATVAMVAESVTLRGVVRNRRDVPVADVLVLLDGRARDYEVRSDATGAFAVADVLPGDYQVVALGPQLLTHSEFVDVTPDAPELALRVDQGALLTGQVVDDLQRPVVGARVTPWRRGPSGEELEVRCAVTTGPRGHFELRGDAEDATFVLVEHAGFVAARTRLAPGRSGVVALARAAK